MDPSESNILVVVRDFDTALEAELAREILEANGVDASVIADNVGGVGTVPLELPTEGAKLLTTKKDLKKALTVLEIALMPTQSRA